MVSAELLLGLGFVNVGLWAWKGDEIAYLLDGAEPEVDKLRLEVGNALYAFVIDDHVKYIGKTARTVRKRFVGYRKPQKGQRTNLRCHANIKEALSRGAAVRIFVFTPISKLRYDTFEINLAAGLEDALIADLDPPWNGREKGQPVTEDAEREAEEEPTIAEPRSFKPDKSAAPLAFFQIVLGDTYYERGLINVGVQASRFLGQDGEPIKVLFDDGSEPVVSGIDRTANRSGGVRIVGQNRPVAQWFKRHFHKGDVVEGRVLDANKVLLLSTQPITDASSNTA